MFFTTLDDYFILPISRAAQANGNTFDSHTPAEALTSA
jgi:hypothetical protein